MAIFVCGGTVAEFVKLVDAKPFGRCPNQQGCLRSVQSLTSKDGKVGTTSVPRQLELHIFHKFLGGWDRSNRRAVTGQPVVATNPLPSVAVAAVKYDVMAILVCGGTVVDFVKLVDAKPLGAPTKAASDLCSHLKGWEGRDHVLDVRTVRMHRGHHEGEKREKRDNLHSDSPSKESFERKETRIEVREMHLGRL
jgi:hypothetical protein